jgi:tRNA C32,U32 (ribose-2'-O)-methylase TrmJ
VYGYELLKARGVASAPAAPDEPLADEALLARVREKSRALLLASGFLNPQQPDAILDELLAVLRRSKPTRRETEMVLAALAQLDRTRVR